MGQHRKWFAAGTLALLVLLGWWVSQSEVSTPWSAEAPRTRHNYKEGNPRFPSRVTAEPRPAPPIVTATAVQESLELAYPEGRWLTCPAPGLDPGQYRVPKSKLRHLRVKDGVLTGVLVTPTEGEGFLWTQQQRVKAQVKWTASGCQVSSVEYVEVTGVVVDSQGQPLSDVEVAVCPGELTVSEHDGSFRAKIISGISCFAFAFRDDEDGFARGATVEVTDSEPHITLEEPGEPVSRAKQRRMLEAGAHQLMTGLDRMYAQASPVAKALEQHPDNPLLQTWSEEETEDFNMSYEEVEYMLSDEATAEDWRDICLFGFLF